MKIPLTNTHRDTVMGRSENRTIENVMFKSRDEKNNARRDRIKGAVVKGKVRGNLKHME